MRINKYILKYRHFFLYCLIGLSGVTVDFLLFFFLTRYQGLNYQYANFFSVSSGITNNFILNYNYNFKEKNRFWFRLGSFYFVGVVGLLISSILLNIFIERLFFGKFYAKILTIFFVTIVQFTMNKLLTFRKIKSESVYETEI
jgi:putative flippase GtrA